MSSFFTPKTLVTLGGVILSFVLPHIFLEDEEYTEYIVPPEVPEEPKEETPETNNTETELVEISEEEEK